MKKMLILALLGLVACGGGGSSTDTDQPAVQEVSAPGEATIEDGDEKVKTVITEVQVLDQSTDNEFSKAAEGKKFLRFRVTVENVGAKDKDLNGSEYRLKLPDGTIDNYSFIHDGDSGISMGTTLTPGSKKDATLTWEVPAPASGQAYILLWKPSPFDDAQAQFKYTTP